MAFDSFPPTTGTDTKRDAWLRQMVYALDEVAAAATNDVHPPHTRLWEANEIPSGGLVATDPTANNNATLTDTNKNWAIYRSDVGGGSWVKRWTGWSSPQTYTTEPTAFDIVLFSLFSDPHGYRNMLRLQIADQDWVSDGQGGFTSHKLILGGAIDTLVPWFPGISYYTHYVVIRRGSGGVFVADRVPEWPNDLTLEWATATATTTTSISVGKRNWTPNQWAGKWAYYTVGGKVRASQITTNDQNTLHFAAAATAPDASQIGILSSNGKYWTPQHQPQSPENETASTRVWPRFIWYRCGGLAAQSYYSQRPDGTLSSKAFPTADYARQLLSDSTVWNHWDIVGGQNPLDIDRDFFTEPVNSFSDQPDWCITPDYHKTLRSWQQTLLTQCVNFIPYRSDCYDGWTRRYINPMSIARLMWEAKINAAHGTTGKLIYGGSGNPDSDPVIGIAVNLTFTGSFLTAPTPANPLPVKVTMERVTHWELPPNAQPPLHLVASPETHNLGQPLLTDMDCLYDGSILRGTFDEDMQQQEIWVAIGNTRVRPSRFRYIYPKECFMPDASTGSGGYSPADPPTEAAPGNWTTRPVSQHRLDFESHGRANDPLSGTEYGAEPFDEGELARYVGDSWDMPTTGLSTAAPNWQAQYRNNFYEGKPSSKAGSRNWDIVASGTVTAVDDANQFADSSLHLWSNGVMIGDSGEPTHTIDLSAASFSSTSITDTSKATSNFWNGTTTGRWAGHWIEVWQPGAIDSGGTAGPLHKMKRPITAYSHASQTLSFPTIALTSQYTYTDATKATHTGTTTVRIREPKYEKNMLAGAIVELTRHDTGATVTGTITYSEDDRIRVSGWTPAYTPVIGDTYSVKRISTGTVWKRSGTGWIKPTGNDTRSGSSTPFPDEQWTIPPDRRYRYGRLMNGDYVEGTFYTETANMRNCLRMTKATGITFTPDQNPTTDVANNNAEWLDTKQLAGCTDNESKVTYTSGTTASPFAESTNDGQCTITSQRSCGWAQIDLNPGITAPFLPTSKQRLRLAPAGKFLTYSTIDQLDTDAANTAGQPKYIFDPNGDPVAFRTWKSFSSFSGTGIHQTSGAIFGSLQKPDKAPALDGGDDSQNFQGYYVMDTMAILDWSGAMNYIGGT